eukprot:CAMPEP_0205808178 /NCGR_PEP_ID=MMETSP0205-20121125/12059_1 /ASSEMBLY_ACC=CAM_ASM_000278 /TAXON_ID=36767 /ORGANISM="Euplotes focardii, Strain TN1" /LENGTH=167 /DNA_ID=CAMNT_0053083451 /DNA_START=86 /DNA_END=589 /DNA_ORIENTATION=-
MTSGVNPNVQDGNIEYDWNLPKTLNIIGLILQVALAVFLLSNASYFDFGIVYVWAATMAPSLIFHFLPFLTRNFLFRFIANAMLAVLSLMAAVSGYFIFVAEDEMQKLVFVAFAIFFLGPITLVSATLVWALNVDRLGDGEQMQMDYAQNVKYVSKMQPSNNFYAMV